MCMVCGVGSSCVRKKKKNKKKIFLLFSPPLFTPLNCMSDSSAKVREPRPIPLDFPGALQFFLSLSKAIKRRLSSQSFIPSFFQI